MHSQCHTRKDIVAVLGLCYWQGARTQDGKVALWGDGMQMLWSKRDPGEKRPEEKPTKKKRGLVGVEA